MASDLRTCRKMALRLPIRQRARLAEHLLASLDQPSPTENDQLWAEEAHRRYLGYKNGRVSARPLAEVMRDARRKIQ